MDQEKVKLKSATEIKKAHNPAPLHQFIFQEKLEAKNLGCAFPNRLLI